MIAEKLIQTIRDIPDFPKPGIVFKDITPIFSDPQLCKEVVDSIVEEFKGIEVDAIAGVEARGFLFGIMLAQAMQKPFILIRKAGKLPYHKISREYALEYGTAKIEMHTDSITPGMKVILHDDLLATGGSAEAAAELIQEGGGVLAGFSFIVNLAHLDGEKKLKRFSNHIQSLVVYHE